MPKNAVPKKAADETVEKDQTNVKLPLDILNLLRVTATAQGRTLSDVVEGALRDYLPRQKVPATVDKMFGVLKGDK